MTMRRGFKVSKGEKVLICEDIITTGGSALEAGKEIENRGGKVVAFSALANRGFCKRYKTKNKQKKQCKLSKKLPLFALEDFIFDIYESNNCPLCKKLKTVAIKPGSRGN